MVGQLSKIERNIESLEWLVANRTNNQKSTLDIYKVLDQHKDILSANPTHRFSAQMLLGVAFSLWTAVFLADIEMKQGSLMRDVEKFLLELIANNTINYGLDKQSKDWTFRYYLSNANYRLDELQEKFEKLGFPFELPGSPAG